MGLILLRRPFWGTRELEQFLLARRSVPFKWGANDCALFVADAIEAMTGVDFADYKKSFETWFGESPPAPQIGFPSELR